MQNAFIYDRFDHNFLQAYLGQIINVICTWLILILQINIAVIFCHLLRDFA